VLAARAGARETPAGEVGEGPERTNLFAVAEQLAARAATPSTRRQYAAIYRSFGDWLRGELGRPPTVEDLDADAIAAYARHLETAGGRGGRPAATATRRIYLSMIRALARELGRHDVAAGVKVPRHTAGPPETLTEVEYENLLRVPDRRSVRGKRDYALLRVLGDCGLRSAELRGLQARDLRRPRANARHLRLFVRGKGGTEREVPVPEETQAALGAWLAVHPLARGRGLRDEQPLFVRLGRFPGTEPPEPLSGQAVHKLVRAARSPPACPSDSRTRTPCAPTGPPRSWRTACPSTASPTASATPTSGPPAATPPSTPTRSTTSPTSLTAATKRRGERAAEPNVRRRAHGTHLQAVEGCPR
jgi:integrase/recombinase XerC